MSDPTHPTDDPAAAPRRKLQNSPAPKSASELVNTPSVKLAREIATSPAAKLVQDYAASPQFKVARELADSPAAKLARELSHSPAAALLRDMKSPATELARGIGLPSSAELQGITTAAKMLAGFTIDPGIAKMLAAMKSARVDPSVADAFAKLKTIAIAPEFANAIREARRVFSDLENAQGGFYKAVKAIAQQNRSLETSLMASLGGSVADVARMSQWASTLGKLPVTDISKLYPALPNIAAEVTYLQRSMLKPLSASISMDQQQLSAVLGLDHRLNASFEATRFKMSAFAGVTDLIGAQTPAWREAYQSLFGQWRTRPDLPDSFWQDARVRRRMYDSAEVDPGLARANLAVAVEVIVESGLTSGVRSDTNTVAVIGFGEVSMTIRSRGTRHDAYRVLGRFEEELRAYITRKLSVRCGSDWFKHRVDGNIAGEAKRIRKQALERGEAPMPLISYTEIGHLASIILNRKNWEEVFGDVFVNQAGFDHDMQKLVAARRPTMHIRPIDGVRLVELICVVQRLSRQMEDDAHGKSPPKPSNRR
ncbi:hypothetical protein [Bradyrhizobium sp. CB3481]|uniref:hypothetical protein n=1 Tax=Bradyrhizobium sp. CB3481 TaxID=3039158 RepID=UPI0024B09BCC|nr:hypothetical protein [Bradyrhizobium sp. CB3481]WFU14399.1 hypothetical protein QA643_24790 [Bradyrhizobium sp. CB3481]